MDRSKRYVPTSIEREKYLQRALVFFHLPLRGQVTDSVTPSFIGSQGRSRTQREGAGARDAARDAGTRETVLDSDGPEGGWEAVAETIRRQGAGSRGGDDETFVWVVTKRERKATTHF